MKSSTLRMLIVKHEAQALMSGSSFNVASIYPWNTMRQFKKLESNSVYSSLERPSRYKVTEIS